MIKDLQHAVRGLLRAPGFTAVAVATLALGIGGTTAMFSAVNRMVLNPLPFRDPDRLVVIWGSKPQEGLPEIPFSQPDFEDLRSAARTLEPIGAWALGRGNVTGGEPEQVQYAVVTASLFDVLEVQPMAGRRFTPADDRPGAAPAAIISHALWQRRFGGAPDAVGRTLVLDGRAVPIVGVLPAAFSFLTFPDRTDVWLPLGTDPFGGRRFARGARSMGVVARLRADVSIGQARAEADTIAAALAASYPRFNTGRRFVVTPLRDQVARGVRTGALVLFGAVACVLLIACANVAGLVLARGTHRRREFAIRAAIGASRARLIRHQLAESAVLALAGGAAGILVAVWIVDLLAALPFRTDSLFVPYSVPRSALGVDRAALAFSVVASGLTSVLFGLLPAIPFSRTRAGDALRDGVRATAGRHQRRARALLVAGEIALALILLVTAGVMIRTFVNLRTVDPGFRTDGILSLQTTLSPNAYRDPARVAAFYRAAVEGLAALPGAAAAGAVEYLPLTGVDGSTGFYIDGRPAPARADEQQAHYRSVTAGYFDLMDVGLADGRFFTDADGPAAPRVAIVNESMARRFWPGETAIGKRVALDLEAMRFFPDRPPVLDVAAGMREIVGVVRDIRHGGLTSDAVPEMFVPYAQKPVHDMTLVVRTSTDPASLAGPARAVIAKLDPDQPVARIETMASIVSTAIAQPRANSLLLAAFAVTALGLSLVGIYGLLAYVVAQRLPELGIRLALGADPAALRRLILAQGLRLVAAGVAAGSAGSLLLTRALGAALPGLEPADPWLIGAAIAALAIPAIAACDLPARAATRVDPVSVLKSA